MENLNKINAMLIGFDTENFTLTKKETGRKSGKFYYEVIDNRTGEMVTNRNSNRDYVACTTDGRFFFGRLDLIEKGDHKRAVNYARQTGDVYDAKVLQIAILKF